MYFLTARDSDIDWYTAYDLGAMTTSPRTMSMEHLLARINALLARARCLESGL